MRKNLLDKDMDYLIILKNRNMALWIHSLKLMRYVYQIYISTQMLLLKSVASSINNQNSKLCNF